MDKIYIVAPSRMVARYFIDMNRWSYGQCSVISEGFDLERLKGLRNIKIIVLNRFHCNKRIIEELYVRAQIANLNLEYQNARNHKTIYQNGAVT